MSAASDFATLQTQLANADRSLFLGQLCWFSVTESQVHHTTVSQGLINNNLGAFIPRLPLDSDVFRRICTAQQRKRVPSAAVPGSYENYLIRDVPADETSIRKVLVRETVSPGATENLKYETELCILTYNREDGSVSTSCIQDVVAQAIAQQVKTAYQANRGMLDSNGIRALLRKVILGVNGVNVRGNGGGIYFVSQDNAPTLKNLEGFAATIPNVALLHTLPLIDDAKQRDMLKRAFESETVDEIEHLISEIADLEKVGKPITANALASYTGQLKALRSKTQEYMNLLDDKTAQANSSINIFERQILRLMTLVK